MLSFGSRQVSDDDFIELLVGLLNMTEHDVLKMKY